MHPHTQRFGVRVSGVRDAAPAGPQDEWSRRAGGILFGGKFWPTIAGGDGTVDPPSHDEIVKALREKRDAIKKTIDDLLATAETEKRELTAEEGTAFTAHMADYRALDDRLIEVIDLDARAKAAAKVAATVGLSVTSEPLTYQRGGPNSYFLDSARAKTDMGDADGARIRLARHAKEMEVELPKRHAARAAKAEQETRSHFGEEVSPFEKRVNPNRTDGQGGYFVPPLWLIDEFAPLARAGRVFADSVRNLTLPDGTDSINIPKVLTGTATAVQTADAQPVQSTDLTDTVATAPVRTIAGQQDIALQLLEQSPIGFDDQVIFPDLMADYAMQLDRQLYVGSGAAGQVQGVNGLAGTNGVTFTSGAPTGPLFYLPLAQSLSLIASLRFQPPTAIFMHPRRWFWLASQLDSQNRPLVIPDTHNQAFNILALQQGVVAEGPAGWVLGLPILIDANVPATQGAGTNEDRVYTVRTPDLYLWEGELRARTLTEILSGTLQVRLQVYNYVAFMPDRYQKSISVVSGTGLVAPAGF